MHKILIVTATRVEASEVLEQFPKASGTKWRRRFLGRKTYYALGAVGGVDVYMVQSQMGSGTPGGALITVAEAIKELSPVAVIMTGICFGAKRKKQKIGDILVSKKLCSYEPQKRSEGGTIPRGDTVTASEELLDKFESGHLDWTGAEVHFGLILSGEKLVNDSIFLGELLEVEPEAIGGEMEGAGLYVAARHEGIHWIIVKAICDWADGKKNDEHQRAAARNSTAFTLHVIQQGGLSHLTASRVQSSSFTQPPDSTCEKSVSPIRSTIPPRYGKPFIGRDAELKQMLGILGDSSREMLLVLHGQSGTGKSELSYEFARRQQSRYPGGTFLIRAGSTGAAVDLASLGRNILCLHFSTALKVEDQCVRTLHELGEAPTLLVYDNVMSWDDISNFLPATGRPIHVVITTVVEPWPSGVPVVPVPPLQEEQVVELVDAIGGPAIAREYGMRLVELSGGLPIQICPLAETLKREHARGLDRYVKLTVSDDASASFRGVYDRLDDDQRLLMHAAACLNPQRIRRDHLFRHLVKVGIMDDAQLVGALDACMDLTLLQGNDVLRMHQLMAEFLVGMPIRDNLTAAFKKVRKAQKEHLVELAGRFSNAPADTNLAAELTAFPLSNATWRDVDEHLSGTNRHLIGDALDELGRWSEALPWYERAVAAKEQGDVHGRVDHASLGSSLHQVGYCYSKQGKYAEALPWYERSVKEAEKGDVHGRIDHESLGASLHQVGICYSEQGKYAEALPWYERAVAAKEQGDVHGRIDHESLGSSLHQVGICYSEQGKYAEALPWYERALACKEQGDVHGRVDHASLGSSLHYVGYCYLEQGKYAEALAWYERAVAAKEQGDVHGRVDEESLRISRDAARACLEMIGKL